MPAQLDTARVVYQPQGTEAPQDLSSVFTQQGREQQAYGAQQLTRASAYFDKAIEQYNELAIEKATQDAPGVINRDGDGVLIPPSSFYPELGWKALLGPAYAKTYRKAAEAIYQQSAAADHETYSVAMKAQFPTDPVGYAAAMEKRRQQVVGNLAPDQAGYIDLRLKQIGSQGATQIGVQLTASENKAMMERADTEHAAIVDDAVRLQSNIIANSTPAGVQGEAAIKAAGEATLNQAILKERWDGLEAMWRTAKVPEAQIKRFREEELGFQVLLKAKSETIKNTSFTPDKAGRIDPADKAVMQERVRAIAKAFPGRERRSRRRSCARSTTPSRGPTGWPPARR